MLDAIGVAGSVYVYLISTNVSIHIIYGYFVEGF